MVAFTAAVLVAFPTVPSDAKTQNPSFSCWWTEPFAAFRLSPSGAVFDTFDSPDGGGDPLEEVTVVQAGSGVNVTGYSNGELVSVQIRKEAGSDGMSDHTTAYSGTWGGQWEGACVKHGSGSIPRNVIGIAENDELNVRSAPSARAKKIASIPFSGSAWVYPQTNTRGWLKVSAAVYPEAESGRIVVRNGWVNAKFVAR